MTQLLVLCVFALLVFATSAMAQAGALFARVASVTGGALLSNGNGSPAFSPGRGYALAPGDRIDTMQGGRVVIDLSDGSLVIVQPGSILTIKDFRAASSIRELFEITLGAVRVKIHHLTGKPNPYRMNSPTASIAVRGTEFDVIVDSAGDTKVDVFEGAVEVGRLEDPADRALIEAGRGVLVRPGQTLQMFGLPLARGVPPAQPAGPDRDRNTGPRGAPVRMAAAQRQPPLPRNGSSSQQPGSRPAMISGAPEHRQQHGDENARSYSPNPAITLTTIDSPLLYRFTAYQDLHLDTYENPAYATAASASETRASLYGSALQLSTIQPLSNSFVAGGTITAAHSGDALARSLGVQSDTVFSSFSAFTARRVGGASVGLSIERLRAGASAASDSGFGRVFSESFVHQTRLTAGATARVASQADLGVYVRHGFVGAGTDERYLIPGRLTEYGRGMATGRTTEAGARLRAMLTARLSYGVVANLGTVTIAGVTMRSGSFAAGMGYMPASGTLISVDAAAGTSQIASVRSPFTSVHVSVQRNISRHLYATASYLKAWRNDTALAPLWRTRFAEFGAGWRLSSDWVAQYAVSSDNLFGRPQHTVAIRYTFRLPGQ
jgi:hypothetical protein